MPRGVEGARLDFLPSGESCWILGADFATTFFGVFFLELLFLVDVGEEGLGTGDEKEGGLRLERE